MKCLLIAAAVLALAVPAHAQLFEAVGNPIVVAGGTYQLTAPVTGNRAAFLLSANLAGLKVGEYPLYLGGVGVALPTVVSDVASQFGDYIMLTVPGVTWYPKGNDPGTLGKLCLQVGYAYVLNGDAKERSGVFAGVGFGWDSPAYLSYKRAVKKAKKAKAAGQAGPPVPPNPYDVH
jgi:hypothetical protein